MHGAGDQPNREHLHISRGTVKDNNPHSVQYLRTHHHSASEQCYCKRRKVSGLCTKDNVRHRETLCPNREGGPHLGMRTIHPQEILCNRNRSQPLVPLLGTKNLDSMPPRILRFRLRLDRFQFSIGHVPGKELKAGPVMSSYREE
jgi:hypothetical protein